MEEIKDLFTINIANEEVIDLKNIFENSNKIHLEIGSGRGEFIEKISIQHPEINFIGTDLKEKRINTILRKLDKKAHKNVRILKIFIDENVTKWFPEHSISKIYLNHPDPWPKKKHHRRRIINNIFLNAVNKILKLDASIQISTDHQDYAKWIVDCFSQRDDFKAIFANDYTFELPENHIVTHFEEKKRKEGFPPIFMEYKKVKDI